MSRVARLTSGPTSTPGSVPSHLERGHALGQARGERLGDIGMHIDAVRRRAGLAEIAHLGQHRALDGGVHVGILEHQHGRVAAELHRRLEHLIGGRFEQRAPHAGRAGKAHHPHARIVHNVIDDLASSGGRQHVDEARRHARLFQHRHQRQHGERGFRGGLDDDTAARRERGGDLAGPHRGGVVPRRHQHGEPGGLVLHHDPRAGGGGTGDHPVGAHGLFGEPAKEFGGIGGLAARIDPGLAVFQRDEMREMIEPPSSAPTPCATPPRAGAACARPSRPSRPRRHRAPHRHRRYRPRRPRPAPPRWRG